MAEQPRFGIEDQMRIGYLVPEFPGQTHAFFWREILALEAIGYQVDVFSTRPPPPSIKSHAWSPEAVARTTYLADVTKPEAAALLLRALGGLRNRPHSHGDIRSLGDAKDLLMSAPLGWRLGRIMRERQIAHVHVHSCARSALVAAFAKQLHGVSYSLALHGFLKDYGSLQPLKWRNAAFATVITREIEREVRQELAGHLPHDVALQPMGIDPGEFVRKDAYVPWRTREPFKVFCCARLNHVKGHLTLLEAIRRLVEEGLDARLSIAGEDDMGGGGYRRVVEQAIVDMELGDRVELLGAVSGKVVLQHLTNSHAFALASLREPLGVAYMEAMACGTPVVGTNAGGVPELIDDGVDGLLVPPGDAEALATALKQFAQYPDLAIRLGAAGRKKVERDYSSQRGAEKIVELVSSIGSSQFKSLRAHS